MGCLLGVVLQFLAGQLAQFLDVRLGRFQDGIHFGNIFFARLLDLAALLLEPVVFVDLFLDHFGGRIDHRRRLLEGAAVGQLLSPFPELRQLRAVGRAGFGEIDAHGGLDVRFVGPARFDVGFALLDQLGIAVGDLQRQPGLFPFLLPGQAERLVELRLHRRSADHREAAVVGHRLNLRQGRFLGLLVGRLLALVRRIDLAARRPVAIEVGLLLLLQGLPGLGARLAVLGTVGRQLEPELLEEFGLPVDLVLVAFSRRRFGVPGDGDELMLVVLQHGWR